MRALDDRERVLAQLLEEHAAQPTSADEVLRHARAAHGSSMSWHVSNLRTGSVTAPKASMIKLMYGGPAPPASANGNGAGGPAGASQALNGFEGGDPNDPLSSMLMPALPKEIVVKPQPKFGALTLAAAANGGGGPAGGVAGSPGGAGGTSRRRSETGGPGAEGGEGEEDIDASNRWTVAPFPTRFLWGALPPAPGEAGAAPGPGPAAAGPGRRLLPPTDPYEAAAAAAAAQAAQIAHVASRADSALTMQRQRRASTAMPDQAAGSATDRARFGNHLMQLLSLGDATPGTGSGPELSSPSALASRFSPSSAAPLSPSRSGPSSGALRPSMYGGGQAAGGGGGPTGGSSQSLAAVSVTAATAGYIIPPLPGYGQPNSGEIPGRRSSAGLPNGAASAAPASAGAYSGGGLGGEGSILLSPAEAAAIARVIRKPLKPAAPQEWTVDAQTAAAHAAAHAAATSAAASYTAATTTGAPAAAAAGADGGGATAAAAGLSAAQFGGGYSYTVLVGQQKEGQIAGVTPSGGSATAQGLAEGDYPTTSSWPVAGGGAAAGGGYGADNFRPPSLNVSTSGAAPEGPGSPGSGRLPFPRQLPALGGPRLSGSGDSPLRPRPYLGQRGFAQSTRSSASGDATGLPPPPAAAGPGGGGTPRLLSQTASPQRFGGARSSTAGTGLNGLQMPSGSAARATTTPNLNLIGSPGPGSLQPQPPPGPRPGTPPPQVPIPPSSPAYGASGGMGMGMSMSMGMGIGMGGGGSGPNSEPLPRPKMAKPQPPARTPELPPGVRLPAASGKSKTTKRSGTAEDQWLGALVRRAAEAEAEEEAAAAAAAAAAAGATSSASSPLTRIGTLSPLSPRLSGGIVEGQNSPLGAADRASGAGPGRVTGSGMMTERGSAGGGGGSGGARAGGAAATARGDHSASGGDEHHGIMGRMKKAFGLGGK